MRCFMTSGSEKAPDHVTENLFAPELSCPEHCNHCSQSPSHQQRIWRQFNNLGDCNTVRINVGNNMENYTKARLLEKINQVEEELLDHVKDKFNGLRAEMEESNRPQGDFQQQPGWDDVEIFEDGEHGGMEEMFGADNQGQAEDNVQERVEQYKREYFRNTGNTAECKRLHDGKKQLECVLLKGL